MIYLRYVNAVGDLGSRAAPSMSLLGRQILVIEYEREHPAAA